MLQKEQNVLPVFFLFLCYPFPFFLSDLDDLLQTLTMEMEPVLGRRRKSCSPFSPYFLFSGAFFLPFSIRIRRAWVW